MLPPSPILLSTAYLPPVQYISKFLLDTPVCIEKQENYQKQSYRNRCYICGANGKQGLVIPVKKQHGEKTRMDEVEIDYVMNWPKNHLKSIESAYRLSAFYEYYADDFSTFYAQKTRLLFDWNQQLLHFLLQLLNIPAQPEVTEAFMNNCANGLDFRNNIHPKARCYQPDQAFVPVRYQQVFQERFGFIPNLSIIDLLFNEGPMAGEVLRKSLGRRE